MFLFMIPEDILFSFFDLLAGHSLTRGFHRKSMEILLERYALTMFCISQILLSLPNFSKRLFDRNLRAMFSKSWEAVTSKDSP